MCHVLIGPNHFRNAKTPQNLSLMITYTSCLHHSFCQKHLMVQRTTKHKVNLILNIVDKKNDIILNCLICFKIWFSSCIHKKGGGNKNEESQVGSVRKHPVKTISIFFSCNSYTFSFSFFKSHFILYKT